MAMTKTISVALLCGGMLFWSLAQASPLLDIPFYSAGGQAYRTITLAEDIAKYYRIRLAHPRVLLVEVQSLRSPKLQMQNRAFAKLGHQVEQYQLLYVVACKDGENRHGYHTTRAVAATMGKLTTGFRVRLLDANGEIIAHANEVVSAETLKRWLHDE